jgi:hypothetical protein
VRGTNKNMTLSVPICRCYVRSLCHTHKNTCQSNVHNHLHTRRLPLSTKAISIDIPVLRVTSHEGPKQCLYRLCTAQIQPVTAIGQSPPLFNTWHTRTRIRQSESLTTTTSKYRGGKRARLWYNQLTATTGSICVVVHPDEINNAVSERAASIEEEEEAEEEEEEDEEEEVAWAKLTL